jgi:hypothetical protein
MVENIAEDDLKHKAAEHGRQQKDGHAVSTNLQPT